MHSNQFSEDFVPLGVIPVKLKSAGPDIMGYAPLDTVSDMTLIGSDAPAWLGLRQRN